MYAFKAFFRSKRSTTPNWLRASATQLIETHWPWDLGVRESLKIGNQQVAGLRSDTCPNVWPLLRTMSSVELRTSGFHSVDAFLDYAEANAVQLCS